MSVFTVTETTIVAMVETTGEAGTVHLTLAVRARVRTLR